MSLVQCVSFPRSGYGYFTRLVNAYFHMQGKPVRHCEYYSCCRQVPCKKADLQDCKTPLFAKNHDFDLKLAIPDCAKCVFVFTREPIAALSSWKEYKKDLNVKSNARFYEQWMEKWTKYSENQMFDENSSAQKDRKKIVFISYENLIHRPVDVLYECMKSIQHEEVDPRLILRAVTSQKKQCNRNDVVQGRKTSLAFCPRKVDVVERADFEAQISSSGAQVHRFSHKVNELTRFDNISTKFQLESPPHTSCEARSIVNDLYLECLDREVDTAGEKCYVSKIQSGLLTKDMLRHMLLSSPEYKRKSVQMSLSSAE